MFIKNGKPAGFLVRNLARQIGRYSDSKAGRQYLDSLTGTNGWIIGYLAHNKDREIFQKDIEETFAVRRSTVSRVVTLMEQKGLIERCGVSSDARLKKLVLTDKALEIHCTIEAELSELEETLIDGISEEDMTVFFRVIERMQRNIGDDDSRCIKSGKTNDRKE